MIKTSNLIKSILGGILLAGGIYVFVGYLILKFGYFHPYRKDNIAEIVRCRVDI